MPQNTVVTGVCFQICKKSIHSIENALVNRADRVICCSDYMAREVNQLFGAGPDKVRVIPNGVNMEKSGY